MANVAVVIKISAGSFADGFSATLEIVNNGRTIEENSNFPQIPPAPQIPELYKAWQSISLENSRRLQKVPDQQTNIDIGSWQTAANELRDYCTNTWFGQNNHAFNSLRHNILSILRDEGLAKSQSVPIIIRCSTADKIANNILRRLPWHLWDLFGELPNAEFALFTRFLRHQASLNPHIRILAIFGSSKHLQLQKDREALEYLKQQGAEIIEKLQPDQEELCDLLYDQSWDILFFAGHSSSQQRGGTIQISEDNFLSLDTLRFSLSEAVRKGLKLAIFNSCDGLGIGDFLGELNVPVAIVMREPVPDFIAFKFLLYFLKVFSKGTPLCRSVREARVRLEGLQNKYPAASWLPVVLINPTQPDLVWQPSPQEPSPQEPSPQEPSLQEPSPQEPSPQEPFPQEPSPQEPFPQEPFPQEPSLQEPSLQEPSLQEPSLQEPSLQEPSLQEPSLQEPSLRSYLRRYSFIISAIAVFALVVIITPVIRPPRPSIEPIENFISVGKRDITGPDANLDPSSLSLKKEGIEHFRKGEYDQAICIFDSLHPRPQPKTSDPRPQPKTCNPPPQPNTSAQKDPEILIYRNNAKVEQNSDLPTHTIAVAAPLNTVFGKDILRGVAQAQDLVVNNPNKPINLKVVIANDRNDPNKARDIAEELSKNSNILAVIGHYTSQTTCAALNVYDQDQNKLVVISPTSSLYQLQKCGNHNKVFFRTVSSTPVEAQSLVQHLKDYLNNPSPKVIVVYNKNDLYSHDLFYQFSNVLQKNLPRRILHEVDISDINPDLNNLLPEIKTEIQNADALAVFPNTDPKTFETAINIISRLNNQNKPVFGSSTLYVDNQYTRKLIGIKNLNLFIAVDWHQALAKAQSFKEQINEYWGGNLNRRTALAYEAVQAFEKAIIRPTVNREDIRQTLPDITAQSDAIEGSSISFAQNGDRKECTTTIIVKMNNQDANDLIFDVEKELRFPSGSVSCTNR